jgi:hypothetical protein
MISYQRNGDGTGTLTITLTGNQAKVESALTDLTDSYYIDQEKPLDNLNNQERLDVIENKIKRILISRLQAVREKRALDALLIDNPDWS